MNTNSTATDKKLGRPASISDAQVLEAGEKLERDGKRVSGYMIRAALGGVGRTARYQELWDIHVAARTAEAAEPAVQAAPVALPAEIRCVLEDTHASVASVLEALAVAVQRHAHDSMEARIADADRRAFESESARDEAQSAGEQAMDALNAVIERLNSDLDEAHTAAADANHALQVVEGVAKERGEKLADAEERERAAIASAAGLHEKLEELRRAAEAQSKELASATDTVRQLEHSKGVAEALATERSLALEAAQKRSEALEAAAAEAQRRSDAAQARADEAQTRADRAIEREHAEIERARSAEDERSRLEEVLRQREARIKELEVTTPSSPS